MRNGIAFIKVTVQFSHKQIKPSCSWIAVRKIDFMAAIPHCAIFLHNHNNGILFLGIPLLWVWFYCIGSIAMGVITGVLEAIAGFG